MGLDMYLVKKRKKDKLDYNKTSEVIYWRKANEIHKWFLDNCKEVENDEGIYEVTKEQLEQLKKVCEEVLNKSTITTGQIENGQRLNDKGEWEPIYVEGKYILNTEIAEKLLPRQDGFFFGSINYDEWYIDDLTYTIEHINNVLETFDFENEDLYYHAWW